MNRIGRSPLGGVRWWVLLAIAIVAGVTTIGAQQPTTSAASVSSAANARKLQLDGLFARLEACRSAEEGARIEQRIFEIWSRSGDAVADSIFDAGVAALAYRDLGQAHAMFAEAVSRSPGFVEAWNKLAAVDYLAGDYTEALRDADHTLLIEQRHYGALEGRGLVLVALGDESAALTSFELALSLNPSSLTLRRSVERLRDRLGYRAAN